MRLSLSPGMEIDGFELVEHVSTGGTALLWAVRRGSDPTALIMKIPLLRDSDDPLPIVCFETEQMIMPRLAGPHVPGFVASGALDPQPYIVMERIPGASLKARLPDLPLPWPYWIHRSRARVHPTLRSWKRR